MNTAEEASGVLQTPILDLIENAEASVRLHNAIRMAAQYGVLPLATVGDYLEAGLDAYVRFMALQNLGRKSALELDVLIRAFVDRGVPLVCAAAPSKNDLDETRVRDLLLWQFSGLSFPDVISDFPISVRLRNGLKANPELKRPYSEYLRDPEAVFAEMLGMQNLGRHSVNELRRLTYEVTGMLLRSTGILESDLGSALGLLIDQNVPEPSALERLEAAIVVHGQITEDELSVERTGNSLAEIVRELLSELNDRSRKVVKRRYGIDGERSETLEEIGFSYGVTRERIRQIEAKVLKQFALPSCRRRLRFALTREGVGILHKAAHNAQYITDTEKGDLIRRIDPYARLTMDVVFKEKKSATIVEQFLDTALTRWKGGWLISGQSVEELEGIVNQINQRLDDVRLPAPVQEVIGTSDIVIGLTALRLGTDFTVFEGYVLPGRAGPRRRRTVRLHKYLANSGQCLDARELIVLVQRAARLDNCSVRDAEFVMTDAPHLFLRTFDEIWYAIGPAPPLEAERDSSESLTPDTNEASEPDDIFEPGDETAIRTLLRNELLEHGPLRFVDLRNNCARRLSGKSANSIGPILLTSGDFVRPLPGIYALPEQLPNSEILPFAPPRFLLMEEQAKWFALARYAGEPFGRYPMWTPEAEYALCRWSQNNANPIVFQSLLAVASIDLWPVSNETGNQWRELQRKEGVYALSLPPRYPLRQLWPPLDRVLAACVLASREGGLSWITSNRVLKRRLDAHSSAGLMALLILIDALEPTADWQSRHRNGGGLRKIIDRLSAQLHSAGNLDWSSLAGRELLDELKKHPRRNFDGWITPDVEDDLLAGATQGAPSELMTTADVDDPISSLEALLAERRRRKESESIREILGSMLSSKA